MWTKRASVWVVAAVLSWMGVAVHAQSISAQWTQKTTGKYYPDGPGQRAWSKLFWDSNAQRIAALGGSAGGGYKMDVWHYDMSLDTWTPYLLPSVDCPGYAGFSAPDGRDAHSAGYDPINNAYWSVAGTGYKCGNAGEGNPVARTAGVGTTTSVIFDASLTSTVVDFYKGWTATINNSRLVYVTAYDPVAKKLTLASAVTGLTVGSSYTLRVWTDGQTWMYSKGTGQWTGFEGPYWGSVTPTPFDPFASRYVPGFAYSTAASVFVFHGGTRNGAGMNDTWVLDPSTKRYTLKKANSSTGPLAVGELAQHFVYDEANDVFVMFGGRCADARCTNGQPTSETWVYSLSTNTWTKKSPAVSPPARMAGAMYYDASVQKVVLFGGAKVDIYNVFPTAANLLNDLWVYDVPTNTWTQINASGAPSARYLQMMAYDPIAQKAVMYGGQNPTTSPMQVWTLQLTQQSANQPPVSVPSVSPASGTTATLFAFSGAGSSDPGGTIVSYVWDFGDGTANGSGVSATHTYASAGTFTVRLTVTDNNGATASATTSVSVSAPSNTPPVANATVSPASGTVATNFAFSGAGSSDSQGPIASYAWNFGDGASGSGVSASHTYASPGSYVVTLTVTDSAGLTNATTVGVVVDAQAPVLTFHRTIAGTIANGSVTQVLVSGQAVPFTTSGNAYTATISSPTPGAVPVTIQYTGPGGTGSQDLSVVVP